jgi:hypothetical protein
LPKLRFLLEIVATVLPRASHQRSDKSLVSLPSKSLARSAHVDLVAAELVEQAVQVVLAALMALAVGQGCSSHRTCNHP